jgi:alkylation response protein AidB-like acyl-CoA dehydrogenase
MTDFIQPHPEPSNRFASDRTLHHTLERLLPAEVFADATPLLQRMGERAMQEIPALAATAEHNVPRHEPFDAWGRRVDRIEVDPAWHRLVDIGLEEGLVALPYENPYGEFTRVVQAGLVNLYDGAGAVASCPLVMTDGAARLLTLHDEALAARYRPMLTARQGGWTSGQWMTEKEGGSDVGQTSTVARPRGNGTWSLHGTKWFTSATTSQMALALARPEDAVPGSRGLSLFLVELRRPDGSWNHIAVRRLKDKLGTRALPTAELELEGTVAVPVGGIDRGVAKIGDLLNVARLWASWGGPAGVGHLLMLARDYASRRRVFGQMLAEKPLHAQWIARITAEYEAMLALNFETALALNRHERGTGAPGLARLLAPLTKLACARQSIWAASELVESFGGAGYVEDTGIPRVLRNLHVHCIWEGTTSVLAHDVLRALRAPEAGEAFLADIDQRLSALAGQGTRAPDAIVHARRTLAELMPRAQESDGRRLAWGMARTYQSVLLLEAAAWRQARKADGSGWTALRLFLQDALVPPVLPASDEELAALAFGRDTAVAS